MQIGISTACLYPMQTIQAFSLLQKNNINNTEIFLNTFSELKHEYIEDLKKLAQLKAQNITALHPFTSNMETFFFATEYETRMEDGFDFYRQYFDLCAQLNIKRFIFHGMHKDLNYEFELYCENVAKLRDIGRKYGVELCCENVVRCKCGYTKYIKKMRKYLNNDISFALDIKQMRRAKIKTVDMVNAMGDGVNYLHLSDCDDKNDCTLPGTGNYDFEELFLLLKQNNFAGEGVIELYKDESITLEKMIKAANYLQSIYDKTNNRRG